MMTWFGIVLASRYAPRWGLLDEPDNARKAHGVPKPAVGVALGVGVLSSGLLWLNESFGLVALGAALALLALGMDDDRRSRPALWKLLVQAVVATLAVWSANLPIHTLSLLGHSVDLEAAAYLFPILWVVALTNAFNLIDGSDGLAVGIAWLIAGSMAVSTAGVDQQIAWSLLGGISVFWWYNKPRARVFLGDGGAYFLGGMLALLSLHGFADADGGFDLVKMALLFVVPLGDVVYAVVRRAVRGNSIFRADDQHIHHRLQRTVGHWPMLVLLYGVSALCALFAWWR